MRNKDQRLMNQRAMDQGGDKGINRQVLVGGDFAKEESVEWGE
jgi:hypothetical protein